MKSIYFDRSNKDFYKSERNELTSGAEKVPIINDIPRFVESDNYTSPFGKQWKRFQKTQLDSTIGFPLSAERLRRCIGEDLWKNLEGKLILEAGCGAGRFTEILLDQGATVVSVDLSDAVEANKNNFPIDQNHFIAQADILNLPFQNDFFDIIVCLGVVQHTENSEATLKSLYRYLKPGGSLVFDHYRITLSFVTRLLPLYRFLFKALKIKDTISFTEILVNLWFPLHRLLGKNLITYAFLTRISPIVTYFHCYPQLDLESQREWSIMDTHDSLFDFYKRLKTKRQILKIAKNLSNVEDIQCAKAGIGIECRCKKLRRNITSDRHELSVQSNIII